MRRSRFLLVAATLLAGGCARGIDVGSAEPSATYSLMVENRTPVPLVVSYSDGRADATLGLVAAGATERFVVAGSTSTSITVRGVASGSTRTSGPVSVTLEAGRSVTVVLR